MSKNKIPLFSIGIATVVALLCGIHSAQAATISTTPSIATRIQTAWRGIQSANYAISIVNSNGGASAVQGWYGTWQNNSARQTFNAYVWDSTTSTPVLEFVQDAGF
jgi:outer membrane lipoprotein-sorting protein